MRRTTTAGRCCWPREDFRADFNHRMGSVPSPIFLSSIVGAAALLRVDHPRAANVAAATGPMPDPGASASDRWRSQCETSYCETRIANRRRANHEDARRSKAFAGEVRRSTRRQRNGADRDGRDRVSCSLRPGRHGCPAGGCGRRCSCAPRGAVLPLPLVPIPVRTRPAGEGAHERHRFVSLAQHGRLSRCFRLRPCRLRVFRGRRRHPAACLAADGSRAADDALQRRRAGHQSVGVAPEHRVEGKSGPGARWPVRCSDRGLAAAHERCHHVPRRVWVGGRALCRATCCAGRASLFCAR